LTARQYLDRAVAEHNANSTMAQCSELYAFKENGAVFALYPLRKMAQCSATSYALGACCGGGAAVLSQGCRSRQPSIRATMAHGRTHRPVS